MKSRTLLVFMELLVIVLVFALAAGLCLRGFYAADRISAEGALRDKSVVEAQNAAEVLKGCHGDFARAAVLLGGTWDGEVWTISQEDSTLTVTPSESGDPLLGRGEILVVDREGREVFSLPVAWQKEVPRG